MSRDKILEKLAKLKALAECSTGNINEVEAAAARMTEFMVRHGISMAEIEDAKPEDQVDELIKQQFFADQKNVSFWQDILLSGIARAFQCRSVFATSTAYRGKRFSVYGHESDVKALEYVLAYCIRQVERFCDVWTNRTGNTGKSQRTTYKVGLADGIVSQIQESMRKVKQEVAVENSRALALYEDKSTKVDAFVGAGVKTVKGPSIKNANIYFQGRETGKNINLELSSPKKGLNPGKKSLPYV